MRPKTQGFSLVEAVMAMMVIGILSLAIIRVLNQAGKSTVSAQDQYQAAQLLDYIQTSLQLAKFEDVFAVDSNLKAGVASGTLFTSRQYFVNWSLSPMAATLSDIDNRVIAAGFKRWMIEVAFLRRDSGNNAFNSSVMDYIEFVPNTATGKCTNGVECADKYQPSIKFQNLVSNSPEHFFDVTVDGQTEVPDTRLKNISIYLYKTNSDYISRTGILLSKEKVLGIATEKYTNEIKFFLTTPDYNKRFYRDIPEMYFGYAHSTDYVAGAKNWDAELVGKFFSKFDYTKTVSWKWAITAGDATSPGLLPKITGYSEADSTIMVWTSTSPFPPVGPPDHQFTVSAVNSGFSTTGNAAYNNHVSAEGGRGVSFRAKKGAVGQEVYSSWTRLLVNTDITPPTAKPTDFLPAPGSTVASRSPFIRLKPIDEDSTGIVPGLKNEDNFKYIPGVSGIAVESISMGTMTSLSPSSLSDITYLRSSYLPDPPPDPAVASPKGILVLIDTATLLPYVFESNQQVYVRAEFGDKTGYKTIQTWSFQVKDMNFTDSTVPDFSPNPSLPISVLQGVPVSITITDPESGVNWQSFEIKEGATTILSTTTVPSLGSVLNSETGTITFNTGGLSKGLHTYTIKVKNWAEAGPVEANVTYTITIL